MNLSVNVTPEAARIFSAQAQKQGKDLETYLSDVIGSRIIAPLLSDEIHNRGRGREIKGTRITVYDVLDYQRLGWQAEAIAVHLRVTPAQVEKAFEYIATNKAEVEHEYQKLVERCQRGNSPEIQAKLKVSRAKLVVRKEALRQDK
jgi:uncharacterized protein (DUF433 family)